jgi:hypothetical protein
VHEPGAEIYGSVAARLPGLLEELLAAPAAKGLRAPANPRSAGHLPFLKL